MITQRLALNIDHESVTPRLQMVQNDSGRGIEFTISDYVIPDGATAAVYYVTPSANGSLILVNGSIDSQIITADVPMSALGEVGTVRGQLQISQSGEIIKSFIFEIDVRSDIVNGRSLSSSDISTLDQVIAALQTQLADIEASMESNPQYVGQVSVNQNSASAPGPKAVLDHDSLSFLDSSGNETLTFPDPNHPYLQFRGNTSASGLTDMKQIVGLGVWYIDNDPSNNPLSNAPAYYQYAYLINMHTAVGSDVLQQMVYRPGKASDPSGYMYVRERYYSSGYKWTSWVNIMDIARNYGKHPLSALGKLTNNNVNDFTLGNETYKTIAQVSLYPGEYLVFASASFSSNTTGIRKALISSSQDSSSAIAALLSDIRTAISGDVTKVILSGFISVSNDVASQQTYYLNIWQNSGSQLTVNARLQIVSLGNNDSL